MYQDGVPENNVNIGLQMVLSGDYASITAVSYLKYIMHIIFSKVSW